MSAETKRRAGVFADQLYKTRALKYAESLVSELEKWLADWPVPPNAETSLIGETKTESGSGAIADEKKGDEALCGRLEMAVKNATNGRDRYTGALDLGCLSELVTVLYAASALFSYCADHRCVTLWLEIARLVCGHLLAEKDARGRASSRTVAMMFHETNGRHLFQNLSAFTLASTLASASPEAQTLEFTPAVQTVVVSDISARLSASPSKLPEPRRHPASTTTRQIVQRVLADYGVDAAISHNELDRLYTLASHF